MSIFESLLALLVANMIWGFLGYKVKGIIGALISMALITAIVLLLAKIALAI